jgi:hypothetical protein
MLDEIVEVVTYSGYRGDEVPRRFFLHETRIEIVEILDTWIEEDFASKARKRFFKAKGNDGNIHQIYYNEKTLEWIYVQKKNK